MSGWTWENGTPRERAEMVRVHAGVYRPKPFSRAHLLEMFLLTEEGLDAIVKGDIWRPEYQRNEP